MTFRKIRNPEEYSALVDKFLTARESLKQSVLQNKLGLNESEYQQTQIQQPTISAIEKLGEQQQSVLKQIQQPTVTAIEKLTEKMSEEKQERKQSIMENDTSELKQFITEIDTASELKLKQDEAEMESIASFLEEMAIKRNSPKQFKNDIMTVDSANYIGGLPVQFDFMRRVIGSQNCHYRYWNCFTHARPRFLGELMTRKRLGIMTG